VLSRNPGDPAATRTILVVDDEPGIVTVVRDYLDRAGFRVVTAADGPTALRLARSTRPSLLVLDLMLPGIDGLDVTRALRLDPATRGLPIIMLTALVEESDRLIGLELGADDYLTKPFSPRELVARVRADDYLTKPFSPRELVARVRAVLRRTGDEQLYSGVLQAGNLTIDLARRSVHRAGGPVELTATEFDLLAVLAREPGRSFTRAQLVDRVYDTSYDGYDRTVDAHMKNLRRKIEPDPRNPQYLLTIYGVGYKFADPADDPPAGAGEGG
jgi:two-component system alkaline phosphatase synthesis response regulator PhoP